MISKKVFVILTASALVCGAMQTIAALTVRAESVSAGAAFYVALNGNDANPGTVEAPFATLERARDAIRHLKASSGLPAGGVTVYLRGGEYERTSTFELNEQDSGTAESPIAYTSYPGEEVRITGGKRLDPSIFSPVTDAGVLARMPAEANGHVLQADLKAVGITNYGTHRAHGFSRMILPASLELFIDDEALTIARWPNEGTVPIASVPNPGSAPRNGDYRNIGGTITIADERVDRWTQAKDMFVTGLFFYGYATDSLRVKSVDPATNGISFYEPHHYGMRATESYNRVHVYNLLEEIDQSGEWYLDHETGILYVYPRRPLAGAKIQVSMMEEPLFALEGVSHLEVSRFVFEAGRGMGIYMERGERNLIAGNTIRNFGTIGLALGQGADGPNKDAQPFVGTPKSRMVGSWMEHQYNDTAWDQLGGHGHRILSNDIYNLGAGGVYASAGNRKTLTPGGLEIVNNRISDYNRIDESERPGLILGGVGNRAAHNLIFNSTTNAILLRGNDHTVEYNEIHDAGSKLSDAGAFSMGRNPSENGNLIQYNFFHHLKTEAIGGPGLQAIFLDDGTSGQIVRGNVFYKAGSGASVKLHGGKHNVIENNIFVDIADANYFQLWTMDNWINQMNGSLWQERLLNAVNIIKPPYSTKYPVLSTYYDANGKAVPVPIDSNVVRNNVTYRVKNLVNGGPGQVGNNYVATTDPGFADANAMNFALGDNSPVYTALPEFQPVPFERMGLFTDKYRTSLQSAPGAFNLMSPTPGTGEVDPHKPLTLMWEPSEGAGMYRIVLSDRPDFSTELFRAETQETSVTVSSGLVYEKTYYWKVEAGHRSKSYQGSRLNEGGTASFSTLPISDVPGSPTISLVGDVVDKVSLTWPRVPYGTGYNVYRSDKSGTGYTRIAELNDVTAYEDQTFSSVVPHYYTVKAVNRLGEGMASNQIAIAPQTSAHFADGFEHGTRTEWREGSAGSWEIREADGQHVLRAVASSGTRSIEGVSTGDYAVQSKVRVHAWTGADASAQRTAVTGGGPAEAYELALTGSGKLVLGRTNGGLRTETDYAAIPGEWYELRLAVSGGQVRGYVNGVLTLALTDPNPLKPGMAGITYAQADADFDDFAALVPKWQTVRAPWTVKGYGPLPAFGSVENGQWRIRAAGTDVWETSDQFGYVYQTVEQPETGKWTLKATLQSIQQIDNGSMAGIMFRSADKANAANFFLRTYPSGAVHTTVRMSDGEPTSYSQVPTQSFPMEFMVTREGDLFTSYYKKDGAWIKHTEKVIPMPKTFLVGLAATSHRATAYTEAVFTDVELTREELAFTGVSLSADRTRVELEGETVRLQLYANYGTNVKRPIDSRHVTFTSLNPSVFPVSPQGIATAVNEGEAIIRAVTKVNGTEYEASIKLQYVIPGYAPRFVPSEPWTGQDIGPVGIAGSLAQNAGQVTLKGSGFDIWRQQDEFFFASRRHSGDGVFVARLDSQQNTNSWAKAGLMIRETLNADSKHVLMAMTPANGAQMAVRPQTNANSVSAGSKSGIKAPYWLKLERTGNTFKGYVSPDGSDGSWQLVGTANVAMSADVHVGLANTSHDNTRLNTSVFSTLSFPPGNLSAEAGKPLVFQLKAEDADGDPVRFGYEGTLPQGAAINPDTGTFTWTPAPVQVGNHPVTLTVTDAPARGKPRTAKASFRIEVTPTSDNQPPVWTNGSLTASRVTETSAVLQWSGAADNVGVARYRIYRDNVPIATVTGSTYTVSVVDLSPGQTYTFRIEAGDGVGLWSTNGPSTIVKTVDKSALRSLIGAVQSLEASDYMPETWTVLQTALQSAIAVTGQGDAAQVQVDEAEAGLVQALQGLVRSIAGIAKLVSGYEASGELKGALLPQLRNSLEQSLHHYDKGRLNQAVHHLKNFIKHLENPAHSELVTPQAKQALNQAVQALAGHWS